MSKPLPTSIHTLNLVHRGKVRDVYEYDSQRLLMVATDRISAFDAIFAEPIPGKGQVLNLLSRFWFAETGRLIPNHLLETRADRIFGNRDVDPAIRGRVSLVKKCMPILFECVVRGHLDGSAWAEYQKTGSVAGHALPRGLRRYDRLPQPLFTPATKAATGHDVNITVAELRKQAGGKIADELESASLKLYEFAHAHAASKGLLLLDTKFEFGMCGGELLLMDEVCTPDSSRFRDVPPSGHEPHALDKQYLRDFLAENGFRGDGPVPALPPPVCEELGRRYRTVFERLTNSTIAEAIRLHG